jgi:carboxymethylenebutenolidase
MWMLDSRALVFRKEFIPPSNSFRARELFLALAVAASSVVVPGAWGVELVERQVEYPSGDVQVPALLLLPKSPGPHAAVLFIHGRSGLNDRVQERARRLSARGFAVLAPDYHTGRFIPENPIDHDPATEQDVERGIDYLKTVPGVRVEKIAVVGLSRGGYHAALLAVRRAEVVGMVGYYPHLADPNAPEPVQIYRYMPEVEQWRVPALLMVGDQDHQARREQVVRVAERLKERGVSAELVVYPGAQRAFDFRRNLRTLGDDLAREDALNRTVRFLNRVLDAQGRERE